MDEVIRVVTDAARGRARTLVGIAGSPGSGKSTLAAEVVVRLAPGTALLPMDGFHLPQARLRELGRRERMGAPDTFDVDEFVATLGALAPPRGSGSHAARGDEVAAVLAPGFDRSVEEPVKGAIIISASTRIVVVEGNYLLLAEGGWEAVAPLLDLSLFVELEHGIRLQRLIERHERFGKTAADARAWATGPDEDNARIIEPTESRATHRVRLD
jgi:pantothenate kinase